MMLVEPKIRSATLAVLRSAREQLATPEHWCKGSLAWTVDGVALYDDNDLAGQQQDDIGKLCAYGALVFSAVCLDQPYSMVERAEDVLTMVIGCGLSEFNDDERTRHSDVLAAFDHAIKLVEHGEV